MITVVAPKADVLTPMGQILAMPEALEIAGRTCYKSQDRITEDSANKFVRMICRRNHESVLEHQSISVRITCSRACSHQLVRHRIGAYSQESMRFVNYNQQGFQVICPPIIGLIPGTYNKDCNDWYLEPNLIPEAAKTRFLNTMLQSTQAYRLEVDKGMRPEDARFMLPIATKTEVVATFDLRTWRHVFRERALNSHAQWEIRGIMKYLLDSFVYLLPCVFEDLKC